MYLDVGTSVARKAPTQQMREKDPVNLVNTKRHERFHCHGTEENERRAEAAPSAIDPCRCTHGVMAPVSNLLPHHKDNTSGPLENAATVPFLPPPPPATHSLTCVFIWKRQRQKRMNHGTLEQLKAIIYQPRNVTPFETFRASLQGDPIIFRFSFTFRRCPC